MIKSNVKKIVEKIENSQKSIFQKKLQHIGPFLMSYTTKKKDYFDNAKEVKKTFDYIFSEDIQPIVKISKLISKILPEYSTSLARESGNDFSPHVIRIHGNGKLIPIHKDNVKYEGKECDFSGTDNQLSCIVHLQEPQDGGQIVIYDKQWIRNDEKL